MAGCCAVSTLLCNFYRSTMRISRCGIVTVHGMGRWAGLTKWAIDPRVTKFGTDIRPNTFLNSIRKYVSSYFRSVAIRQFVNLDILNFLALFPRMTNGLIKIHRIWYGGHTRCPTHNNRNRRHWPLAVGCTRAILIFTVRLSLSETVMPNFTKFDRIDLHIPSDIFPQNMTLSTTSFQ